MACKILQRFANKDISQHLLTYYIATTWKLQNVGYAAAAPKAVKKGLPTKKNKVDVETDPKLLCSRLCGGNIYKEGEDPLLSPDEDYPEWLWNLRYERGAIPLEELSEDDPRYWKRLKKLTIRQQNKLRYAKNM